MGDSWIVLESARRAATAQLYTRGDGRARVVHMHEAVAVGTGAVRGSHLSHHRLTLKLTVRERV